MYSLGSKSIANLTGVHPKLVAVVKRAIKLTSQDFTVQEGLRSITTQKSYVARGVSKTLNSKHIKQDDNYGHAVDLVPWFNSQPRWEWPLMYPIAAAMQEAAREENVQIRWGGNWSTINFMPLGEAAMKRAVNDYVDARRKIGRTAFIDGPHYELVS